MRVEVGFPGCEKAVAAGGEALWMWLSMKAYCKVNETDGRVPACMIGRLQGPDPSRQKRLVQRLIGARLVDQKGEDFWLHDYLDWEESSEQAQARRAAQRHRKAEWERKERERRERERNAVTNDVRNATSERVSNGSREGKGRVVEGREGKLPTEEGTAVAVVHVRSERPSEPVKIPCPDSLSLTREQRATLETSMVPDWAIDQITTMFVAGAQADQSDRRTMVVWRKCLSKAISGTWNDPGKRPKKIDPSAAQRRADGLDDVEFG